MLSECVFRERGVVMSKRCSQSMRGCCQCVFRVRGVVMCKGVCSE